MKNKFMVLLAALGVVFLLPTVWANTDTYYYAKATAKVSSTGGGKVYASATEIPSPDSMCTETTSTSGVGKSAANNQSVTLYRYAKANDGFEFKGWSTADNADISTISDTSTSVTVNPSATSESIANNYTYYAYFAKLKLEAFGITFETSDAGTYTVDGVAPANRTGLTEATTVKLASSDPNFLNWKVNGADFVDNPYTATCLADTTIGAEFLTADQVAEATTFDELTTALANDSGKRKITIPTGVDIIIAKDATVTVLAGKQLVVNGSLAVVGTLANSGAISGNGKIYKISKKITQGEIITPVNGAGGAYASWKYRNTTVETITPSITGVDGVSTIVWGVLYNGDKVAQMSQQSPKAIKVSIGTDSINTISSIADNADANEVATSDHFVLFADCNLTGPILEKSNTDKRLNFTGWIDCAGKKITHSVGRTNSSFHSRILNGTVSFTPGTDYQNATATFVNCGSITVKNIKGTACPMHFYDCGTEAKPTSLTFGYNSSPGTRKNYFYSGYYTYSFSTSKDDGNTEVRGGSFTTDPTSWLQNVTDASGEDTSLKAVGPQNGLYKVVAKPKTKDLAEVNGKAYQSLQAAVDEIAANTPTTLKLMENVVLEESLVIPEGKSLTIELDGHDISGISIVNNGALRIEDNSNQAEKGILSAPVVNNGNGTIDLTYGQYAGKFTLNGGSLTTHGGTFTSTFSYEEKGGTANLRGGTYNCAITVPAGHELVDSVLGETCKGVIICDNPLSSAGADVSYTVRGLDPVDHGLGISDFELYSNLKHSKSGWMTRSDFAGREALWDRLAELRCTVEPVESKAFEATMAFDRPVKAGSISGIASVAGRTETMALEVDVAAGEDYHVFIPMVTGAGYYAVSYKNMFNGEENDRWAKLMCGVKNNGSLENIGTTMTFKYQLRTQTRAEGYSAQNPVYDETFTTYASATYKFTGKGAIYGDKDYDSLAAAIDKVENSGTIRLSKDCAENVTVGKEMSFTLDTNNFEFTGAITAAKGFKVKQTGNEWKIYSTVVEVPLVDGEESKIAIEIDEELEKRAEKEEKSVAEVLNEVDANGVKVWENQLLKAAPAESVTKKVVQEVKNEQGEIEEKEVEPTANLPTGIYVEKTTVELQSTDGETVEHTVEVKTARIQNDASADSVMVAVAGDTTKDNQPLTVANVIPDAAKGDVIQVYDKATGLYRQWTRGENGWVGNSTVGGSGDIQAGEPEKCELEAGQVFWYKRAEKSDEPITTVAVPKENIKVDVEQGTPTKEAWTMVPNLSLNVNEKGEAEGLDLDEVKDEQGEKPFEADQVIVPTEGISQRTYTFKNDKWGYNETKSITIGGRTLPQTERIESGKLPANKNFWWVSGGGKPNIILNESKK